MASALDGIIILDLTSGAAGAQTTMLLGDHGARILRLVDRHDTTRRHGGYLVWDRGKDCRHLDFATLVAAGPQRQKATQATASAPLGGYESLIRGADVLVEDFAPSSTHQVLVTSEWLAALNPRLIHCSITAYGKHGPLKDEPPIDELVMARMGILGSQPGFRPPPVHVVHPLPSVGAALLAAQGIAAALLAREKTGYGRQVETSLMAGALLYHPKVTAEQLEKRPFQSHPAGSAPFYSVYECRDGNWVQLGCVHAGFTATAAKVMGIKDIIDEPRFNGGRPLDDEATELELRAIVAQTLRTRPYAEWARLFEDADVPFAQARLTEESFDDPQVQANGMVSTLHDPEVGPLTQMGVPIQLSATPGKIQGPRQLPGEQLPSLPTAVTPATSALPPGNLLEPPLQGIRVLEITNLIAGPTAGRLLADLGADVIKFEPLEGDMSRPIGRVYFFNLNANKRSVSANTRTPEGKEVVQKIAATSDVLLANLRPHATERMGLSPDVMQRLNPRLIETHLTGYGWSGPYAHRPGIDPLAQALMGLERAQGGPENPPVFPAQLAPTDFTTGALGTLGTILALFVRERTGIAQRVYSNLLNGGILLSSPWFTIYEGKPQRRLADKGQYGLDPFHRLYQLSDGWIYIVADTPETRLAVGRVLERPDLGAANITPSGEGHPNDTPLAQTLARCFAPLRLAETLSRLQAAGVPCAPALEGYSDIFLNDPHAAANDMIAVHQHPVIGQMHVARHYIRFGNTRVVQGRATPLLGEQTREVLLDVGFSEQEVAALHDQGVVKTEVPATVNSEGLRR